MCTFYVDEIDIRFDAKSSMPMQIVLYYWSDLSHFGYVIGNTLWIIKEFTHQIQLHNYSDVIRIVASQITDNYRLFVQKYFLANIKQKITILHYWPFATGSHRWHMDSSHNETVMRKALTCHESIKIYQCMDLEKRSSLTPTILLPGNWPNRLIFCGEFIIYQFQESEASTWCIFPVLRVVKLYSRCRLRYENNFR